MWSFNHEWEKFHRLVVPQSAGEVQRTEMKRAFFAGAYALLTHMMTMQGDEDEQVAQLESIKDDVERVLAGMLARPTGGEL